MTEMTGELAVALATLSAMKHPSVAALLKAQGFKFEAKVVERVATAYENARKEQL